MRVNRVGDWTSSGALVVTASNPVVAVCIAIEAQSHVLPMAGPKTVNYAEHGQYKVSADAPRLNIYESTFTDRPLPSLSDAFDVASLCGW